MMSELNKSRAEGYLTTANPASSASSAALLTSQSVILHDTRG